MSWPTESGHWKLELIESSNGPRPVVWSTTPGDYTDVYGEKKLHATRPVFVLYQYASTAILYAWIGAKIEKIWMRD